MTWRDVSVAYLDKEKGLNHFPLGFSVFRNPNERHVLKCPTKDALMDAGSLVYEDPIGYDDFEHVYFYWDNGKNTEVIDVDLGDTITFSDKTLDCTGWLDQESSDNFVEL